MAGTRPHVVHPERLVVVVSALMALLAVGLGEGSRDIARAAAPSALEYSTFLGGIARDEVLAIDVDESGNTYVAGLAGPGFPTTHGAFDVTVGGSGDGFVTKFDPGGEVVYSTVIGGGKADEVRALTVDENGNASIAGVTRSAGFPTTKGAYDRSQAGGPDVFVSRLAPSGDDLVFSTFVGRGKVDVPNGIAVADGGAVFCVGFTGSKDFPTTRDAWRRRHSGAWDAFALKLAPSGARLRYSTLFGGSEVDEAKDVEVRAGRAFINGFTASPNLPTTKGAFDRAFGGSVDTFVLGLTRRGSRPIFATYLGARNTDVPAPFEGLAVDPEGDIHVVGTTASRGFPVTENAYASERNGPADAFVTELHSQGAMAYSTFYGGSSFDDGQGIDVEADGDILFSGVTTSSDLPEGTAGYDATLSGHRDAFVAELDTSSNTIGFSSYFGGIDDPNLDHQGEWGYGVAVGSSGTMSLAGGTDSVDLPTTSDALQVDHAGFIDGYLTTFSN